MYPQLVNHWIEDGEVGSAGGATFEKRSPIDDRVIAQVARGGANEVCGAIDAAERAAEGWGRLPAPKRGEILGRAAALLRADEREFA